MYKQYLAVVFVMSGLFSTDLVLADTAAKPESASTSNSPDAAPFKINEWWKVTTDEGAYLFKPESAILSKTDIHYVVSEFPMTANMKMEFNEDSGVFSSIKVPYEQIKFVKILRYRGTCIDYVVATTEAEKNGYTCPSSYNEKNNTIFVANTDNGKNNYIISRFEGTAVNLNTGKKWHVGNAVFRLKSIWLAGEGTPIKVEVIRDQSIIDPLLEKADKLSKETEAKNARVAAESESERIAKQNKIDKIRKDTLKELASSPKGSEDSCQNTNYSWDGNLINDTTTISCQMAGDGITIRDLKPAGWIVTNVSKAGEKRTTSGLSTQYILSIKKVK